MSISVYRWKLELQTAVSLCVAFCVLSMLNACGQAGHVNNSEQDPTTQRALLALQLAPDETTLAPYRTLTSPSVSGTSDTRAVVSSEIKPTYGAAEVLSTLKAAHGRTSNPVPYYLDANGDGVITQDDAQRVLGWALKGVQRPNVAPSITQPTDLVVVANRQMDPVQIAAFDPDDSLLNFSVDSYTTNDIILRDLLGWPRNGPLTDLGLTLDRITGVISGTPNPSTLLKAPIAVTVTDNRGASDTKRFNVEIISDSLSTQFITRDEGGAAVNELKLVAADTSRGGTVAYCITTSFEAPNATDPCFRSDAEGGRTRTIRIPTMGKVPPYYLFTKTATNSVLSNSIPTAAKKPLVLVETNKGSFVLELEAERAKVTTENFMQYVDAGFFNNTVFHRIFSNFVIQGGGYTYQPNNASPYRAKTKLDGLREPILLEKTSTTRLSNTKGTIAMARTYIPDSATSQFFINVVDNAESLDAGKATVDGYAVFGKVIPPDGGKAGDLPKALRDIIAVPVSGSLGGGTETSLPIGPPPTILSTRRIN